MKIRKISLTLPIISASLFFIGCYKQADVRPFDPEDDIPPSVIIAFPPEGPAVSGKIMVRALANDNTGIQKVALYVDGLPVGEEAHSEPYEMTWNTFAYKDSTVHIITVRAFDLSSNRTDSDPLTLFIDNSAEYPIVIQLEKIKYADSAYSVVWSRSPDKNFLSYTLLQSFQADLSDETEVFSSGNVDDTVYYTYAIPPGDMRYYRLRVTNQNGLESYSPVETAYAPECINIPLEGLMAWYPFNGNAFDESGNGHDGTILYAEPTTDRHGKPGKAYDFQVNSGYIIIPGPASFNDMDSFTLAAWIYRKGDFTGSFQSIISKISPQRDFVLQLRPEGNPSVCFAYDPAIYYCCTGPSVTPVAEWVHLAAAWTGDSWKLYVNGNLVKTESYPGSQPPWTGEHMYIGSLGGGEVFQGCIDEVLIYGRELSETEILGISRL